MCLSIKKHCFRSVTVSVEIFSLHNVSSIPSNFEMTATSFAISISKFSNDWGLPAKSIQSAGRTMHKLPRLRGLRTKGLGAPRTKELAI
jgi:hypothetical protein